MHIDIFLSIEFFIIANKIECISKNDCNILTFLLLYRTNVQRWNNNNGSAKYV